MSIKAPLGLLVFATLALGCGKKTTARAIASDIDSSASEPASAPSSGKRASAAVSASASAVASASAAPPAASPCKPRANDAEGADSPDGTISVYVDEDPTREDVGTMGARPHQNLCIVHGSDPPRILVEGRGIPEDGGPEQMLAGYGGFVFSPDGKVLYFTTEAWVTAGAAHAVDLRTGRERFLFDGAVNSVLTDGPYKGMLLASHFRLDDEHPMGSPLYTGRGVTTTIERPDGTLVRKLPSDEAARERILHPGLGTPGTKSR